MVGLTLAIAPLGAPEIGTRVLVKAVRPLPDGATRYEFEVTRGTETVIEHADLRPGQSVLVAGLRISAP